MAVSLRARVCLPLCCTPLCPLVGVAIGMERGCQQKNDRTIADGCRCCWARTCCRPSGTPSRRVTPNSCNPYGESLLQL